MKKVISLFVVMSMLCCIVQVNTFAAAEDTADDLILSDEAPLASGVNYGEAERYENAEDPYGFAEEGEPQFAENRVIVKVANSVSVMSADESDGNFLGVEVAETEKLSQIQNVSIMSSDGSESCENGTIMLLTLKESGKDKVRSAIEALESNPSVLYAEPDYIMHIDTTPNDKYYSMLWGMEKINAPEAWEKTTGSRDVVVGVIDTGIDYTHEDLAANMWTNPGEIPDNGIDDDGNGYIDDVYGWNFVSNTNDPMDDHFHGTHVSSTVGGVGNNGIGVAGVCHNVSLMAIKVLNKGGSGEISNIIKGIEYAGMMGAPITNNSYGLTFYTQAMKDVIDKYSDRVFVAAAGNDGVNNDTAPHYPASYECDNIIAVGASTRDDKCAYFSNYGVNSVDIFAPGYDICGAIPNNKYASYSGTSMATPHVAGAAALVKSMYPNYTVGEIKEALLQHCDQVPSLNRYVKYGSILNVAKALEPVVYSDVSGIALNVGEITIKTRERIKLTAVPVPFVVRNKDIVWSSSDETIVTVTESGVVQAMGKEGAAVVTAASAENESVTAVCAVTVSGESREIEFKDPAFKQMVVDTFKYYFDADFEKYPLADMEIYKNYTNASAIYAEDAEKLTQLSSKKADTLTKGISDISGIEYFKNLEYLAVPNNKISTMDLSMLENLTRLECNGNALSELKVNPDASWTEFYIYDNYLDISESTELGQAIEAIKKRIKQTDKCIVSPQNAAIEATGIEIECGDLVMDQKDARLLNAVVTPIDNSTMNVIWESSNPEVVSINAKGTITAKTQGEAVITATSAVNPSLNASINITVTDKIAEPVTFNPRTFKGSLTRTLRDVVIDNLKCVSDEYADYTVDTPLYPEDLNKILTLAIEYPLHIGGGIVVGYVETLEIDNEDLLKFASVEEIYYNWGGVTHLDLRPLTNLTRIYVLNKLPIETVNLSGLRKLTSIELDGRYATTTISELNIDGCMNLTYLYLCGTDFEELDLSGRTELTTLYVTNGRIKSLNLSGVNKLERFYCDINEIETLDLTSMTKLTTFYAPFNHLTELKVPHGQKYSNFVCDHNYLDTSPGSQFMQDMEEVVKNLKPGGGYGHIYLPQNVKETLPIEVDKKFMAMSIVEEYSLNAVYDRLLGENLSLVWSSDNPDTAEVDANGTVTALSSGTAYITVHPDGIPNVSAEVLVRVFEPGTDGDGSTDNPYVLRTKEDILFLSGITRSGDFATRQKYLYADYILKPQNGEYIDMEHADFTPIGYGFPLNRGGYRGIFDGNDKEIRNLNIDMVCGDTPSVKTYDIGFFASIYQTNFDMPIKDVSFTDANISVKVPSGASYLPDVGIVAGAGSYNITNVSVSGNINVEGKANGVGGLCGNYNYNPAIPKGCIADVDINAQDAEYCGGILGYAYGAIESCYSVGNITGGENVGGISGNGGYIRRCYSLGNVTGKRNVGGIVGKNPGVLENSFSGAEVTGEENIGGIIGDASSISEDKITGAYRLVGQIVNGGDNELGNPLTLAELYNADFFGSLFKNYSRATHQYDAGKTNYNPKVYKVAQERYGGDAYYPQTELVKNQPDVLMTGADLSVNDEYSVPYLKRTSKSVIIKIKNIAGKENEVQVITAEYGEDELTDANFQPLTLPADASESVVLPRVKSDLPKKVYLWDMRTMLPITEPIDISANK